jgi:Skp family chaperone for outer membrane proteins
MRILVLCILFSSCQLITGQKIDEQHSKDVEFEDLLNKVNKTSELSAAIQDNASKKAAKIVTNITALNAEVSNLKNELNEAKAKLDSAVNTIDTGSKFILRTISTDQKNR